ncbi:MAG: hypothetical protein JO288_14320 [Hyphomicrobiales bacterium]|nr:hypothetical protein [Hyphomicrobiales bacterium]
MAALFVAYSPSHWLVVFPAPVGPAAALAGVAAPGALHPMGFDIHCDWL